MKPIDFQPFIGTPKPHLIAGVHLVYNVWGAISIVSRCKSDRHRGIAQFCTSNTTRWLFPFFLIFTLMPGEMVQFDEHIFQVG